MKLRLYISNIIFLVAILFIIGCKSDNANHKNKNHTDSLSANPNNAIPEGFYQNKDSLIQITFGGENSYSTFTNDSSIYFNSYYEAWNTPCDQIFETNLFTNKLDQDQPNHFGKQKFTYSRPVYNSLTHTLLYDFSKNTCLISSKNFTITLSPNSEIYLYKNKKHIQLTHNNFYDGDADFSPDGKTIVCTSMKTGDPELWLLDLKGDYIKQITHHKGFDGNASFSPNGNLIIYVSDINDNFKEQDALLEKNKVDPAYTEIMIYDLQKDSSYTVINPGKANLHPCFTPNGKNIIFSSNYQSNKGLPFNLYLTDLSGSNIMLFAEGGTINDYPTFPANGKYIIFASNRNTQINQSLNLYFTAWK